MSLVWDINQLYKDIIMKNYTRTSLSSTVNYCRLSLFSFLFLLSCSATANVLVDENVEKNISLKASQAIEVVNINTADEDVLTTLKGVGKVKAQAIVKYRKENGHFSTLNSLVNVKGIGEKILVDNKNKIIL